MKSVWYAQVCLISEEFVKLTAIGVYTSYPPLPIYMGVIVIITREDTWTLRVETSIRPTAQLAHPYSGEYLPFPGSDRRQCTLC